MFLSEFTTSGQFDLLNILKDLRDLQRHTRRPLPLMADMNIHYRLMKFMYCTSMDNFDLRQWLCNVPLLFGVWHPYKYCVLQVYRVFFPIFALLEHSNIGEGMRLHCAKKVLHVEKVVCALLLVRHTLVPAIQAELSAMDHNGRRPQSLAVQKTWLNGFLVLLNVYCPMLLAIGNSVRNCTWDGRKEAKGKEARQVLQDCLVLLVNLLGDTRGRVEYVRTLCVALLGWSKWMDSLPGCCFQEENCEALLSRMAGRCRAHTTFSSIESVNDLFVTLPPTQRKLKSTRGVRPFSNANLVKTQLL